MKMKLPPILALATLAAAPLWPMASAEEPPRGPSSHDALFLPLDFYPTHREALRLSDDQMRELQRIAEGMRGPAEKLEAEMRDRGRALHEIISRNPVDADAAMERFKAVLQAENEMKALQFRSRIAMRRVLTPEQNEKAQRLAASERPPSGGSGAAEIQEKLQLVRQEIRRRSPGGEPPREALEMIERIEQAVRQGHLQEAGKQLDSILGHLRKERGESDARRPDGAAQSQPDGLEQRMRHISELAKRTEKPELREQLQGALRRLREAAETGDREAIERTLNAIEPALREASKDTPK